MIHANTKEASTAEIFLHKYISESFNFFFANRNLSDLHELPIKTFYCLSTSENSSIIHVKLPNYVYYSIVHKYIIYGRKCHLFHK